ncbi:MAG: beta-N-acetylhexosaminidase, partial [Muribaculaceae bacterium]|nr:beta-N-acetylhexosaminidase [Muribaculaceae bacterium]
MKLKRSIFVVVCALLLVACNRNSNHELFVIPAPKNVSYTSRSLTLSADSVRVTYMLVDTLPDITSAEGYVMEVNDSGVIVKGLSETGLFYGRMTLEQLLESSTDGNLPGMVITDEPRFEYRGMMLDVSRHFRDKEFVKKQMDMMARLKLNRLHLHLTDAAGWRLEIKKYPRLTEFAAWRPYDNWQDWQDGGRLYCESTDPKAQGGYYTREDVKELVDYAAQKHITIIPEIEMPSHSEEVLAAYPELSCTHVPYGQSDFCPGNEAVFTFLEDVLDEVMELFPSHYIHVGGDEAAKSSWQMCELCRKRMATEGLADVDELQSYLIGRVERYLNSRGRDLIGWDEIMEGGLAPNATVMSWRGIEGGMRAAADGHKAIMTPGAFCYLDSNQDDPSVQPVAMGGYLPLSKVYSYNPVPDSLPADIRPYIIGVQGNLWCEHVSDAELAEYLLWPRMIAIAETGWTPESRKSYDDFLKRTVRFSEKMKIDGYNVFNIKQERGNRPESLTDIEHLAKNKPVTYNRSWWENYPAAGSATL